MEWQMNDRAAPSKTSRAIEFFWILCFLAMAGFALAVIVANLINFVFGVQNLKPEIGGPIVIASFIAPFCVYFYLRTDQGKATLVAILRVDPGSFVVLTKPSDHYPD